MAARVICALETHRLLLDMIKINSQFKLELLWSFETLCNGTVSCFSKAIFLNNEIRLRMSFKEWTRGHESKCLLKFGSYAHPLFLPSQADFLEQQALFLPWDGSRTDLYFIALQLLGLCPLIHQEEDKREHGMTETFQKHCLEVACILLRIGHIVRPM